MRKHIKVMIEQIKRQLETVVNESNREYLYGKLDAYEDMLMILTVEGEQIMEYQLLLDLGFKLTEYQLFNSFKIYTFKNDEEIEIEITYSLTTHATHYEFRTGDIIEGVVIKVLAEIDWGKVEL